MPSHDLELFDRLGELLTHERRAEAERFAALHRDLTLAERAARGYALTDLVVTEDGVGFGGRVLLHLEREGGGRIEGRIDSGDQITLRPRRAEISETLTAVVARRGSTSPSPAPAGTCSSLATRQHSEPIRSMKSFWIMCRSTGSIARRGS